MKANSAEHAEARVGRITSSTIATVLYGTNIGLRSLSDALKRREPATLGAGLSPATEWGVANEPAARAAFVDANPELNIGRPAFVVYQGTNELFRQFCGVSPDLCVYDGDTIIGGAEIKCPYLPENHIVNRSTRAVPEEYRPQVQYMMFCCNVAWWRFVSFDPRRSGDDRYSEIIVEKDVRLHALIDRRLTFFLSNHLSGGDFKDVSDPFGNIPQLF